MTGPGIQVLLSTSYSRGPTGAVLQRRSSRLDERVRHFDVWGPSGGLKNSASWKISKSVPSKIEGTFQGRDDAPSSMVATRRPETGDWGSFLTKIICKNPSIKVGLVERPGAPKRGSRPPGRERALGLLSPGGERFAQDLSGVHPGPSGVDVRYFWNDLRISNEKRPPG